MVLYLILNSVLLLAQKTIKFIFKFLLIMVKVLAFLQILLTIIPEQSNRIGLLLIPVLIIRLLISRWLFGTNNWSTDIVMNMTVIMANYFFPFVTDIMITRPNIVPHLAVIEHIVISGSWFTFLFLFMLMLLFLVFL